MGHMVTVKSSIQDTTHAKEARTYVYMCVSHLDSEVSTSSHRRFWHSRPGQAIQGSI